MDKQSLYDDYIIRGMSTRDIAKKYNISQTQVRRLMKKYNIKARSSKERTSYYYEKMDETFKRFSKEYMKEEIRICPVCENKFTVTSKDRKKKYCSKDCRIASMKKPIETFTCVMCGDTIENINGRNYKREFCVNCRNTHLSLIQVNKIDTECGFCKKKMSVIPSRYKNAVKVYCSTECMAKDYENRLKGENNPMWNGGKLGHYKGHWIKQREKARQRDKNICQLCGLDGDEIDKNLDIHHIKAYRLWDNPDDANKLDNLVCLCPNCHKFIHSKKNIKKLFIDNN